LILILILILISFVSSAVKSFGSAFALVRLAFLPLL